MGTPAQNRAKQKWVKNNLDRLEIRVPKGEGQGIKDHAAKQGESLNGFLCRAVRTTMEQDNSANNNQDAEPTE